MEFSVEEGRTRFARRKVKKAVVMLAEGFWLGLFSLATYCVTMRLRGLKYTCKKNLLGNWKKPTLECTASYDFKSMDNNALEETRNACEIHS